jgi:ElaB/YqjD/DUF883 family membrane-anchored ribosome-binding protein
MSNPIMTPEIKLDEVPHDLGQALKGVMEQLDKASHLAAAKPEEALSHAAKALSDAAEAMMAEVSSRTTAVAKTVAKDVSEHPLATAATIATAAAGILGLVLATQKKPTA